ncbi:MAG: hypothetical protein AABX86_02250 [Nanoarchaeota archaeon]
MAVTIENLVFLDEQRLITLLNQAAQEQLTLVPSKTVKMSKYLKDWLRSGEGVVQYGRVYGIHHKGKEVGYFLTRGYNEDNGTEETRGEICKVRINYGLQIEDQRILPFTVKVGMRETDEGMARVTRRDHVRKLGTWQPSCLENYLPTEWFLRSEYEHSLFGSKNKVH